MKRLLIFILLVCPMMMVAGEATCTTVVGQILDEATGQPLANINLSIVGSQYGTTTNEEGIYCLRVPLQRKATMLVSAIGYKSQRYALEPGQSVAIDILLKEKTTDLADVFVLPGSNPAIPIMNRVRAARRENAVYFDQLAEGTPYAETQVYVSDLRATHLRRQLWRSLSDGMIRMEDSTYLLPLYHRTIVNDQPQVEAEVLPSALYEELLDYLDDEPNFYQNSISILQTNFLSPLSQDGNAYYKYYLVDSFQTETGKKRYVLDYKSKNPFYPTFNGSMTIDSASCRLVSIVAEVPNKVSVNYLKHLSIEQHDSVSSISLLLDVAIKGDTTHTFPTVLITHQSGLKPISQMPEMAIVPEMALVDSALQEVKQSPIIKVASFFAYAIQTGYIPTGSYVEIGPVNELIRTTPQEGLRLGVPLRTSEKLMKHFALQGYVAYGFRDHAFKGSIQLNIDLPTLRRHQLFISYTDDYNYSELSYFSTYYRENAIWFKQMGMTTALTRGIYARRYLTFNRMVRQRQFMLSSTNDWTDHMEQDFFMVIGREGYDEPTEDYNSQRWFRHTTMGTTFRIGFDEKKVDMYFRRVHVYGRRPVIYIGAEMGSYQTEFMNHYGLYGRLNLMVRQEVHLGVMGRLNYLFEAGMILGKVPYPLLSIFDGNQSYAYDLYRFTLMHNYQYAADKYMLIHAEWNGKGCLFNLIPGIRYLRLRELVTFKFAWGTLSQKHQEVLPFPNAYHYIQSEENELIEVPTLQDLNTPYVEMGVGIGNILRIMDIHSIWKLTHRNDIASPNWAIRFRFNLEN